MGHTMKERIPLILHLLLQLLHEAMHKTTYIQSYHPTFLGVLFAHGFYKVIFLIGNAHAVLIPAFIVSILLP